MRKHTGSFTRDICILDKSQWSLIVNMRGIPCYRKRKVKTVHACASRFLLHCCLVLGCCSHIFISSPSILSVKSSHESPRELTDYCLIVTHTFCFRKNGVDSARRSLLVYRELLLHSGRNCVHALGDMSQATNYSYDKTQRLVSFWLVVNYAD